MQKTIAYFATISFLFIAFTAHAFCAQRIFYEDCEDTSYSNWFLERSIGTSNSGYWSELTSELTRSSESPYAGSYSMTYDPWITANPHTNEGIITTYGNTEKFDLTKVHTNTYYFRWKHRWQTGVDYSGSVHNKNIYIGYGEWGGDFVFVIEKGSSSNFHIVLRSNPGYQIRLNTYQEAYKNLDDMQWHNIELYLDLGTTGPTGYILIRIDGHVLYEGNNIYFRDAININGGVPLNIIQWPSNTSGTTSGHNRQWLDNLEIWDGMPDSDPAPTPTPSPSPSTSTLSAPTRASVVSWSANIQADNDSWSDSSAVWCTRVLVQGDSISTSGNNVILSFQGRNSGEYSISKVSIAEKDPNGQDGDIIDNTWTMVTFNDGSASNWSSSSAVVPAGVGKRSDTIPFNIEKGKDYYVTFMMNSPTAYLVAPNDYSEMYFSGSDHTEDLDWGANGHSTYAARLHALVNIAVQ